MKAIVIIFHSIPPFVNRNLDLLKALDFPLKTSLEHKSLKKEDTARVLLTNHFNI